MDSVQQNNRRIAKNTMLLYFRMLITLFVGLYTSRVVLATLGVSDYGLYSVVGGVIGMFGFLTGMLSAGTQRFITYEIGTGNLENLKRIFSTSLCMYLILAGVILILGETIGLWFVCNKMNFEPGRETGLSIHGCYCHRCSDSGTFHVLPHCPRKDGYIRLYVHLRCDDETRDCLSHSPDSFRQTHLLCILIYVGIPVFDSHLQCLLSTQISRMPIQL